VTDAELEVKGVRSGYGDITVIRDVSFAVPSGSITVILGRNGAGKTTLLKTIAGLIPASAGDISIGGVSVIREPPYRRQMRGLGFVQENKRIFKRRSVEENLRMGAYAARLSRKEVAARMAEAYARFAVLGAKRRDVAGYLSGGEQQMLAISQALMSHPRLLLLDEPSIVQDVLDAVRRIKEEEGRTVLMVEQSVDLAISVADRVLVLDVGQVVHSGSPADAGIREIVEDTYFGRAPAGRAASPAAVPAGAGEAGAGEAGAGETGASGLPTSG
jgi:branched-chain amino acid transport system ATP-binding protein